MGVSAFGKLAFFALLVRDGYVAVLADITTVSMAAGKSRFRLQPVIEHLTSRGDHLIVVIWFEDVSLAHR